ncbi:MAG: response regulator [Lachnospiraceae bacterium]|nr:response regulator [Lachnospiraceae bacterium]
MANWVMVVDDDTANLKIAGTILSKNNMHVTAVKSGRAMLDYISEKGAPDLILLDIKMPEMDGFEALAKLRELEKEKGFHEIPVIFLTADDTTGTESKGFEVGVSDYIRKPFNPEVLLRRIDNVISMQSEVINLKNEATIDKLTGFLNKAATGTELTKMCAEKTGCLMMIDLDSFKLVNDIYGHEMGDRVLFSFAQIIKSTVPAGRKNGRIGGDEFVSFALEISTANEVAEISRQLNEKLLASAKRMMGEDMTIPLGASIGAIMVPKHGNDYTSLLKLADKLLYDVKKNKGKHGYSLYSPELSEGDSSSSVMDIHSLTEILSERNIPNEALYVDMESFSYVYRFAFRYFIRNNINACRVLFTLSPKSGLQDNSFKNSCEDFGNHVKEMLRKSDMVTKCRYNQYYVLISDVRKEFVTSIIQNITDSWYEKNDILNIDYETEYVKNDGSVSPESSLANITIIDDDPFTIEFIKKTLANTGIGVTSIGSGKEFFDYASTVEKLPDLILLDVELPDMDGFEILEKIRGSEGELSSVAVVFLTADANDGTEIKCLSKGAMDFIRKPILPEILRARINHILELVMLRKRYKGSANRA